MVKRLFCGILFLALATQAPSVQGADDHIHFAQAGSGSISAVLTGSVEPCSGSSIFPLSVSSIGVNGNEFNITSFFAVLDPLFCPSPPQHYEVTASLGTLGDGHYTVVWTAGPLIVHGEFDVRSGVLGLTARPVPTLTLSGLIALCTMMIAVAGLTLLRRRQ
jgi:hypothetical protein